MIYRFETLMSAEEHFSDIYSDRNSIYLSSRIDRIELFEKAIADLSRARRDGSKNLIRQSLGSLAARAFAIPHQMSGVAISNGMEIKFPKDGCAYCQHDVCICGETRPNPEIDFTKPLTRKNWSIEDWQNMLGLRYGNVNQIRGTEAVILRLSNEVMEVRSLEKLLPAMPIQEIRQEYSLEIADLMAWIMASASMLEESLQDCVVERYSNGCPTCMMAKCVCTQTRVDMIFSI